MKGHCERAGTLSLPGLVRAGKLASLVACGLGSIMVSGYALGQPGEATAGTQEGKALFDAKCGACHDPAGMGTALLARKRPVALLEERPDLTAPLVVLAGRRGIGSMPALPRGELSDSQLRLIADYIAAGPYEVTR